MNTSKISNFILDILFPISCFSCGKTEEWLCPECLKKIKLLSKQACPYCEKNITESGIFCSRCREKYTSRNNIISLDSLVVAASYQENIIPHLVHMYKYNFIRDLSIPLGQIMIYAILKNNLPLPNIIIPVPLHPRRERWRGFNQSELLASYIGQNLTPGMDIPVLNNFIARTRYTKPQMKIKNYQERQKNISNIFSLNTLTNLSDKSILLVDDIATTGATLFECAKVLKKYGAKKVMGIVIARQEIVS